MHDSASSTGLAFQSDKIKYHKSSGYSDIGRAYQNKTRPDSSQGLDTYGAEDEETNRFGANYFQDNYQDGTVVDSSILPSEYNSEPCGELEAAMIKRSEIVMRDRTADNEDGKNDSLRQSTIVGFPALLMSQTDLNMNSKMNLQIMGMFMKQQESFDLQNSTSFVSIRPTDVSRHTST